MEGGSRLAIGVDLGGTHVRAAAVSFAAPMGLASIVSSRRAAMRELWSWDAPLDWIVQGIYEVRPEAVESEEPAPPVGLAVAGLIDPARRIVTRSVNLPFLEGRPLLAALSERLGSSVALFTDADAATWAEYCARHPRPDGFAHLRLGTGIGLGLVLNGRLQPLEPGRATHASLLVVEKGREAIPCRCGLRGCLETIASGPALTAIEEPLSYVRGSAVVARAVEGIVAAAQRLHEEHGVTCVSIGGGVVLNRPELVPAVMQRFAGNGGAAVAGLTIQAAVLGDDAGVIGAARLAAGRGGFRAGSSK